MYSVPSSRKIASTALIALLVATICRLATELISAPWELLYDLYFAPLPYIDIHTKGDNQSQSLQKIQQPNAWMIEMLTKCHSQPDPITNHISLKAAILDISMKNPSDQSNTNRYFNPAIVPLPSHSKHSYLLVSRLVTEGLHQESHVCFAEFCSDDERKACPPSIKNGLFCTTVPVTVQIPPTPALKCTGEWSTFVDIPGFHDPRVFWSGRGEPFIEVNSGSQYGCVGLWIQDLRSVWPELEKVLVDEQHGFSVTRYRGLTELTRNPRKSRHEIEKNWVLFFPRENEAWIQYDVMGQLRRTVKTNPQSMDKPAVLEKQNSGSNRTADTQHNLTKVYASESKTNMALDVGQNIEGGRTIAQLFSHGITTENSTSALEKACFDIHSFSHSHDSQGRHGKWHQGTNSLRIIGCTRMQMRRRTCHSHDGSLTDGYYHNMTHQAYEKVLRQKGLILHFSFIHRKFTGRFAPLRYERYLLLWEAQKPFQILGVSRFPLLFENERARPWNMAVENVTEIGQSFTYTPSIAWAVRQDTREDAHIHGECGHEDLGTGYLDDHVVVGVGVDDVAQGVVNLSVQELLQCIRTC